MRIAIAHLSLREAASAAAGMLPALLLAIGCGGAQATVESTIARQAAMAAVPFVANAGQWDAEAAFAARTFAGTLYVTRDGRMLYSLPGRAIADGVQDATRAAAHPAGRTPGWALSETLVGVNRASMAVPPRGERRALTKVNYFTAGEAARLPNLETYEQLDLGEVYPGIRAHLRAAGANVEKIFTVAPGQDPSRIRILIGGATAVELGLDGQLVVHTGNGALAFTAPVAFQEDSYGKREPVTVRYTLDAGSREYGFALAAYDAARPLIIDPLLQSTYLGGTNDDQVLAMAIHATNGVYVAGTTASNPFPGAIGGALGAAGRGVFVSRYSADLATLLQSSYVDGSAGIAGSEGLGLAIRTLTGDVYVGAGDTISRFNANLTTVNSTVLTGASTTALVIDQTSGNLYVIGNTTSAAFPGVAAGTAQLTYAGGGDAFVSKFSADLATLFRSTYLGGSAIDSAQAAALHPVTGELYVAGYTLSQDLPALAGGAKTAFGSAQYHEAFISRLSADLSSVNQSTFLGGFGADEVFAMAIHGSGDIYVAGRTGNQLLGPIVPGGAQTSVAPGAFHGMVFRFNLDLKTATGFTFLGGTGNDQILALAIGTSGEINVAGTTASNPFPGVTGGAQATYGSGITHAFVSRFSADLSLLPQSSYLGGSGAETAFAVAIHPTTQQVYIAGRTSSTAATFPGLAGAPQPIYGGAGALGYGDAFISRFTADLALGDALPDPFTFAGQSNVPVSSVRTGGPVQITGLGGQTNIYVDGQLGSTYCASSIASCADANCDVSAGYVTSGSITSGKYVCVRHTAAPQPDEVSVSRLHIGGGVGKFWISTGNVFSSGNCTLDIDGNNIIDPLTDGLIALRAMFGLTGAAVTNGAVGGGAPTRSTWSQLQPWLNTNCGTNFAP